MTEYEKFQQVMAELEAWKNKSSKKDFFSNTQSSNIYGDFFKNIFK